MLNYESFFSRGYYVTKKSSNENVLKEWSSLLVGGYRFKFHPKTEFYISQASGEEEYVVFVGKPTCIENPSYSSHEICCKSAKILNDHGFNSFLHYVAYLGGRFLAFVIRNEVSLKVVPDCHATYACYYSDVDGGSFASHVNLLGLVEGLPVNEKARSIVNSSEYKAPGGKYYPALMLPYEKALTLIPNCYIENSYSSGVTYSFRFYPFSNTELHKDLSKSEIIRKFQCALLANLRGIVKDQNFYVSLTGGMDSGVALSSIINSELKSNAKAFTYFNASSPTEGAIKDVMAASGRAFSSGIQHKVLDLKPLDMSSTFHRMYSRSFKLGARFPSLARAYYEELPHDILSLVSTCSETGTAFYRNRDEKEISPEVLANKFSRSAVCKNRDVIESFSDYIDYTQFDKSSLGPIDFYDAFYWEHRNAKWASLWYAEADLSHFTVVPFNQRNIIELMLSLPLKEREEKDILESSLNLY